MISKNLRLILLAVSSVFAAHLVVAADDADNTNRNRVDKEHKEVTPSDQGSSKEDLNTTKQIRQAIVADKSLSTNAHNIKVITSNGRVTLRGPVESASEKNAVEKIASAAASGGTVDSQLEVKMNDNKQ